MRNMTTDQKKRSRSRVAQNPRVSEKQIKNKALVPVQNFMSPTKTSSMKNSDRNTNLIQ